MALSSIGTQTAGSGRPFPTLKEIDIASSPAQVSMKNGPAEMSIQMQEPEMKFNWDRVWESIGLLKASTFMHSISSDNMKAYAEDVSRTVSDGKQIARSIANGDTKIYAKLTTQRYIQEHEVQTEIGLMPEKGPEVTVKTYLPEINVDVSAPQIHVEFPKLKVTLKPASSNPPMLMDQRI